MKSILLEPLFDAENYNEYEVDEESDDEDRD